jgi:hypothetical protein
MGMIDVNELKFKLSVVSNTKQQLREDKRNFRDFVKDTKETIRKGSNDIGRGVTRTADQASSVLGAVNREDIAIMEAVRAKGKSLQEFAKQSKNLKNSSDESNLGDNISSLRKGNAQFNKITATELKVTKITGGGVSGGRGRSLGTTGGSASQTKEEGLKEGLKTGALIPIAGAVLAALGATYAIISSRGAAFTQAAKQQYGGLQTLGFSGNGPGGFYKGIRREDYGVTGSQQVEMMASFARQTGTNKQMLESLFQGNTNFAMLQNAYGFGAGQLGQWAGNIQRFGQGKNGRNGLLDVMQMGTNVGMGGARQEEFINDFQEAMTQAVYTGSSRSVTDLTKSLGTMMKTPDERLKALAPQALQSMMGSQMQASMLKGGVQESWRFQAVQYQLQKQYDKEGKGQRVKFEDIQDILDQKGTLAEKYLVQTMQEKFGKGTALSLMLSQFGEFKGGRKAVLSQAQNWLTGTPKTKTTIGEEVSTRMEGTKEARYYTQMQDVRESTNILTEANKTAATVVDEFRDKIEQAIQKLTEFNVTLDDSGKNKMPADSYEALNGFGGYGYVE